MVKLNLLRKKDPKKAHLISRQIIDNVLQSSGITHSLQDSTKRNLDLMNDFLIKSTIGQNNLLNESKQ